MGGAIFEFSIIPSGNSLAQARTQRLSLLNRLFGRSAGQGDLELRLAQVLKPFRSQTLADLRQWLEQTIPSPWKATQAVIEGYLCLIKPSDVTLHRRVSGTQEEIWMTNTRLSGCAGMAEVSSWLISHWMETWFRRSRDRIDRELLGPYGITPGTAEPESMITDETFLPLGEFGYAMFDPKAAEQEAETADSNGEEEKANPFELDGAVDETDSDRADRIRCFLRERFTEVMRDGKCRCQLCMPDFDLDQMRELPA